MLEVLIRSGGIPGVIFFLIYKIMFSLLIIEFLTSITPPHPTAQINPLLQSAVAGILIVPSIILCLRVAFRLYLLNEISFLLSISFCVQYITGNANPVLNPLNI